MLGSPDARRSAVATLPEQRRSQCSTTLHKVVAARASAIVLDREGLHEQADQLRAEADLMERGEIAG